MLIAYKDIILRDYKEEDIADDIRWMTEEIAWHEWDAPWEAEENFKNFNADRYYEKAMKKLQDKGDDNEFRWKFEIDTKDGIHIGGVNSYLNDIEYNWKPASQGDVYILLELIYVSQHTGIRVMVHKLLLLS